jgi:hypothetical protein
MSWKKILGITAAVIGVLILSYLSNIGNRIGNKIRNDNETFDATMEAEIKSMISRLPIKQEGDGTTIIALKLDGRVATYDIRFDEHKDFLDSNDSGFWDTFRTGMVAALCTDRSTRQLVDHNYTIVYRFYDHKGTFKKQFPAISNTDCKKT